MSVIGKPLKPKHNQGCGENVHLKKKSTDTFVLGCLKFITYRENIFKQQKMVERSHYLEDWRHQSVIHVPKCHISNLQKNLVKKNTAILDTFNSVSTTIHIPLDQKQYEWYEIKLLNSTNKPFLIKDSLVHTGKVYTHTKYLINRKKWLEFYRPRGNQRHRGHFCSTS